MTMCRHVATSAIRRQQRQSEPPDAPEPEEPLVVELPEGAEIVWCDGWRTVWLGAGEKN